MFIFTFSNVLNRYNLCYLTVYFLKRDRSERIPLKLNKISMKWFYVIVRLIKKFDIAFTKGYRKIALCHAPLCNSKTGNWCLCSDEMIPFMRTRVLYSVITLLLLTLKGIMPSIENHICPITFNFIFASLCALKASNRALTKALSAVKII